jgi:ribosomal-protein-alanine N-acetyltransferase
MQVKVRKVTAEDLWQVARIDAECFDNPWTFPNFVQQYEENQDGFLVAEKESQVVGFSVTDGKGVLLLLAVKKQEQRRGIGSLLLQESLGFLKGKAVKAVAHVKKKNRAGTRFYLRNGFKREELLKDYYSDGDAWVLSKKL